MNTLTLMKSLLLAAALALPVAGCGDDEQTGMNADARTTDEVDAGFVCDPVGDDPAMGALLNAPVESDVQIIVKDPQHPGDPGPENLP